MSNKILGWEDHTTRAERMNKWTFGEKTMLVTAILLWVAIFIRLATMPEIFI
jgi:hypothetical protein